MKRLLICTFATVLLFTNCKKDEDSPSVYKCATCPSTPEANATYDNSNRGIYKGVMLGSTGTIRFDNMNSNNGTMTAMLTIDGVKVNLVSTVQPVNGVAYLGPFTGTLNGQPVSITLSVGATGQNPTVTSATIPGHPNAVFVIAKETSSSLMEAFEGKLLTNEGAQAGTFNILLSRALKSFTAVGKVDAEPGIKGPIQGTYTNGAFYCVDNEVRIDGEISGDVLKGTIRNVTQPNTPTGKLEGKRTL